VGSTQVKNLKFLTTFFSISLFSPNFLLQACTVPFWICKERVQKRVWEGTFERFPTYPFPEKLVGDRTREKSLPLQCVCVFVHDRVWSWAMDALTSYFTDKKKEDEVQVIPNCWFMDGFVAVFFFHPSLEHQSFFFQKHISLWTVWFLLCYVTEGQENQ